MNRQNNGNHKFLHPDFHMHFCANIILSVLLEFPHSAAVYNESPDETLISTNVFFMAAKFVPRR